VTAAINASDATLTPSRKVPAILDFRMRGTSGPLTATSGNAGRKMPTVDRLTRPHGITTSYAYDNLSRLMSVLHKISGGTTLDGAIYTYDNAGNRLTKANSLNSVTEGYSYDPL